MLNKMIPGTKVEVVVNDAVADDSDKSFTPAKRWRIQAIVVVLVATATAGNRQMVVRVLSGADLLFQSAAGAVQAQSTTVTYNFAEGNAREVTAVAGALDVPLPSNFSVDPSLIVQVLDSAAIDAAADDMTVRILAETF